MVIEKEIGELLRSRHLTMGTAESCTGGYIAPVSYTHLDVYKRQRSKSSAYLWELLLCCLWGSF